MNKLIVIGLVALIGISGWSTYYTQDMKQSEAEKGPSIEAETSKVKEQIAEAESEISQIETEISKLETQIAEEKGKQGDIRNQIDVLTQRKSALQEQVDQYKKMQSRDPRGFITVDDPVVKAKVEEITKGWATTRDKQEALFEYVRDEITYVTEGNPKRYIYPKPFLEYKFDFWQYPKETIEWKKGDCEDQAILLCTMMRAAGVPASDVRVAVGLLYIGGEVFGGHAWCEFKMGHVWYVLESTCPTCSYIERADYYKTYSPEIWGWFNDEEYHIESGETACNPFVLV